MTMPCEGDLVGKLSRIGKVRSYAMPMTQADDESLDSLPKRDATFIEPMECLATSTLPDGPQWLWEMKHDGYRALAVKSGDELTIFSRRRRSLNLRFPSLVEALADLPAGTVVDGELVALDDTGRPNFNLLQNLNGEASHFQYYIFDLLCYRSSDLTQLPLLDRRELLKALVRFPDRRIKVADDIEVAPTDLLSAVREQGLEGIVGKRKDSLYEAGQRSGAWIKYRVNRGQEFVIGGYIPGPHGLDSVIAGYYDGENLIYVARVKNGLVETSRRQLFEQLRPRVTSECPFANLPETCRLRWSESLTLEGMKKCVWVRPDVVVQIAFLEWIEGDHLRNPKFVGRRDDRDAASVVKEHSGKGP
jgi:DNA ligase D-like protein (predicted ligase)